MSAQTAALVAALPRIAYGPAFDEVIQEWELVDTDSIHFYGCTRGDCERQFADARRQVAAHLRHCPQDAGLRGMTHDYSTAIEEERP